MDGAVCRVTAGFGRPAQVGPDHLPSARGIDSVVAPVAVSGQCTIVAQESELLSFGGGVQGERLLHKTQLTKFGGKLSGS